MMISSSLSSPTKLLGIGARIAQVRFPLSQTMFANSLGIHKNTLMQYETEEELPDAKLLTRIYEVYRVDPIWLLSGEPAKVFARKGNITFLRSDNPTYASCTFAVHDESKNLREDISFKTLQLNG
jgi:transcriptional regulator with XRE-family HTH domain